MEGMVIDASFWKGRRVLITGHTGFKGSWLAFWLADLGADVAGYALPPATTPNMFELAEVGARAKSTFGDVRNLEALLAAFTNHAPEIVFHLAAQAEVLPSYRQPVATYATNVMGTAHLLDAVRQTDGVRAVVVVTTDKVYQPMPEARCHGEEDPLGGNDPYSSSKACAELVTAAYRSSFFDPADYAHHRTAVASVRAGNAIGGGDWAANRLIPDAMRAFAKRQPLRVRWPDAVRPWQHVLEPLAGYLLLAEQLHRQGPAAGGAWNFGPADNCNHRVRSVLDLLATAWGEGASWNGDQMPHLPESRHLQLDSSRARRVLGWQPRWSLKYALEQTVDWYRAHLQGREMTTITREQINSYCTPASQHAQR